MRRVLSSQVVGRSLSRCRPCPPAPLSSSSRWAHLFFENPSKTTIQILHDKIIYTCTTHPPPPPLSQPPLGLSTPAVFKALDLSKLSQRDPRELLSTFRSRLSGDKGPDPNDFVNDLEPPAFQCVPELAEIKNKLLVRRLLF